MIQNLMWAWMFGILGLTSLASAQNPSAEVDALITPVQKIQSEINSIGYAGITDPHYQEGMVKHSVFFRYSDHLSDQQKEAVKKVKEKFLALKEECRRGGKPYILSIDAGVQNSAEGADQGMQDAFIVTFKSLGDRNYYVGQPIIPETETRFYDPAHVAFKKFVGPLLATPPLVGAIVIDFSVCNKSLQ